MRIALIALTDFQRFPTGGILTFVRRFLESVSGTQGVSVALIGWSPHSTNGRRAVVRVGASELEFHSVCEARFSGMVPDRLQFYGDRNRWKEALSAVGDVDVYYCHSPEAALRVAQSGRSAPIALHLHGAINTIGRSRFALGRFRPITALYESTILSSAVRRARAVFATVSESDFQAFRRGRLVEDDVLCQRIPAMVTLPSRPGGQTPGGGRIRMVCVGRVESIKGIDLLVRTTRRLIDRGTLCELKVIGEGSQRGRLERLAAELGLGSAVRFLGALSQAEVYGMLAESHVFLSGSYQEGFSLALLEALSTGLPAVVTDVGSAREVIRNGVTGYVVERRDPDLFASCITAAASARWSMRDNCEATALHYNCDRVSSGIMDSLNRVALAAG